MNEKKMFCINKWIEEKFYKTSAYDNVYGVALLKTLHSRDFS